MDGNCVCHHLIKTTEYIWGTISPWAWKFSPQLDMICHAFCILTLAIVSQNWNKYMSVCDLIKVTSMYCDCFHCLLSCLHTDIPFHCYLLHRYLLTVIFLFSSLFFFPLSLSAFRITTSRSPTAFLWWILARKESSQLEAHYRIYLNMCYRNHNVADWADGSFMQLPSLMCCFWGNALSKMCIWYLSLKPNTDFLYQILLSN